METVSHKILKIIICEKFLIFCKCNPAFLYGGAVVLPQNIQCKLRIYCQHIGFQYVLVK